MGKQKKICLTENCRGAQKSVSAKKGYEYCAFCGAALSYICSSCGTPISAELCTGKNCLCESCRLAAAQKRAEQLQKVKTITLAALPVILKNAKKGISITKKTVKAAQVSQVLLKKGKAYKVKRITRKKTQGGLSDDAENKNSSGAVS